MWVAMCRGLGAYLPDDERLVVDPFGLAFGGPAAVALGKALDPLPRAVSAAIVKTSSRAAGIQWMQLRSRVIDDAVEGFVADGGAQVVILGAGFDCRAYRLPSLAGARVFEVDHPATQRLKRARMDSVSPYAREVDFVPWDFEARPVDELPAALASLGHDPARPTITLWEGVTMYLTEPAIDQTVRAVRALGAGARSTLVFNYFERDAVDRRNVGLRLAVRALGEPFRFGWRPTELPAWFAARGFRVRSDRRDVDIAKDLLPRARPKSRGAHIVVAES